MDGEYPDPDRPKTLPSLGGPYFIPGVDPFAFTRIDDHENVGYDEITADDTSSDEDDSIEEASVPELDPSQLSRQPESVDRDADFDPTTVELAQDEDDDELFSDSELESSALPFSGGGSVRGRGRGARRRGRGPGRPRGRRGSGMTRDSRAFSIDDHDVDEDIFGARRRAPRRVPRGEGRGAGRKGKRGPQVAIATKQFSIKQMKASAAFAEGRFEDCAHHCTEAIQENPEIFAAHSLLSHAYYEMGRKEDSLETLWNGALTRRETSAWKEVVKRIIDVVEDETDRDQRLSQAYSNIVRIDREDYDARIGRLEIFERQGNRNSIVKECRRILLSRPYDLQVLRMLAEATLAIGVASSARPAFETAIPYFEDIQSRDDPDGFCFDHLNLYMEVLRVLEDWQALLLQGKRLARWLLGRRNDIIWDNHPQDDREWDDEDEPRRTEISTFVSGEYAPEQYGQGLPADLRVKFGLGRLNLGPTHFQEALRHFEPFDCEHLPIEAAPDFADLIRDIADALHFKERHADSLRFYKCFEGWRDADSTTWKRAGVSAQAIGDEESSLKHYLRYLVTEPKDTEIRLKVAAMFERAGDTQKATQHLDESIRRETIWTLRSKQVTDGDSMILSKLVEARVSSLFPQPDVEDQRGEQPTAWSQDITNPTDINTANPKFPKLPDDLSPRQYLQRMFGRILWRPRSRPSFNSNAPPSIPREGAHTPEHPYPGEDPLEPTNAIEASPSRRGQDRWRKRRETIAQSLEEAEARVEQLYEQLQDVESNSIGNNDTTPEIWTEIAQQLCVEFFEQRSLFPSERNIPFAGFSSADRQAARTSFPHTKEFLNAMGAHLMLDVKDETLSADCRLYLEEIPMTFASVSFPRWLDIILQTALNLAHHYKDSTCYSHLDKTAMCAIYYNHKPSTFHVQLTYLACATALQDNMKQNEVMRYFANEFTPEPDVYKLQQLVNRVYNGPVHSYSTGPQQKFYSRLVKAHDSLAMSRQQRKGMPVGQQFTRNTLTSGATLRSADLDKTDPNALDPMLLIMHGNMIAANNSHHINAINYYMRAYAAQRDNPLALLSMSVAYAHMAMKRLSVNRSHQVVSAIAALMRYKEMRMLRWDGSEMVDGKLKRQRRMETEYNEGRLWHFLGLMHLATPCYERVLELESGDVPGDGDVQMGDDGDDGHEKLLWSETDFKAEAALALQSIYVHAGDGKRARELGERFLVF